jgi:hypothetical protein
VHIDYFKYGRQTVSVTFALFIAVVLVSIAKLTMVVILLMVYCTIMLSEWKIVQETGIEESNTIVLEGGMVTTYDSVEQFSLKSEVKPYDLIKKM